jgi:hypothetical protein
MRPSLDAIWADLYFELEVAAAEARQATDGAVRFHSTDEGPQIVTNAGDECWMTRVSRTDVICGMTWRPRAEGEGAEGVTAETERTVRFRLEEDGAFPLTRLEGEAEVPETTTSAARYLLETFRRA